MRITTKKLRATIVVLDDIIKEYKKEKPETKRDWRTYEQRLSKRIRSAMIELEPLVEAAVDLIKTENLEKRGRKCALSLKQKTLLLLLKRLFGKSNREMSSMLVVFSLLSNIDVSYKTIERLYSDEEVEMVLHNIHSLLLKAKDLKHVDCSGDGTGYSLTIKKHYATEAQKLKDKIKNARTAGADKTKTKKSSKKRKKKQFVYAFKLMDLDTRMYLAYGTSLKSEKAAFLKAVEMAKSINIDVKSLRLDKYYSAQMYVKSLKNDFNNLKIYLIPKKNATLKGTQDWKRMCHSLVENTKEFLGEYFKRNQSESGMSEDKRRFGWTIAQRIETRIDTSNVCAMLWHNLFWMN